MLILAIPLIPSLEILSLCEELFEIKASSLYFFRVQEFVPLLFSLIFLFFHTRALAHFLLTRFIHIIEIIFLVCKGHKLAFVTPRERRCSRIRDHISFLLLNLFILAKLEKREVPLVLLLFLYLVSLVECLVFDALKIHV